MTYNSLAELFTAIANSIRGKTGGTEKIVANDFPAAIDGISSGGGDEGSALDSLINKSITEVNSNVTYVGDYVFQRCRELTSADFPLATAIGPCAFQNCLNLTEINFPVANTINNSAFSTCSSLTSVVFPSVTKINNAAFDACSKLKTADFWVVTSIAWAAFNSCSALDALILRNTNQVCSLSSKGNLNGTLIASGSGYIYVPSALIDSYKAATNWSDFAAQFRALEDYTVDGATTGELDSTKI